MSTDPFLSDPDDGVVERAYAQLASGNDLGHKTDWCHTSGMRDPSQTTDSVRNSMNPTPCVSNERDAQQKSSGEPLC